MSQIKLIDETYNNNAVKFSYHKSDISKINKVSNKAKNKGKKLKINSNSELEFLYNDSQDKSSNNNKNMKLKKKNIYNYSSNEKNTTDIMTPKIDLNDNYSRQQKQTKSKKSSYSSFDLFWKNLKEFEQYKENKINNLKTEIIKKQISELRKYPKISKNSIILANSKERDALYLKRPFSEEKYLEEDFLLFYKNNLDTIYKEKIPLSNEQRVKEKFNKFYQDNMRWKKNKEESNDKIRDENTKRSEDEIDKMLTFRPLLSKNTNKIMQRKRTNKNFNLNQYNDLYNCENERELLDKLKLKLKPVLSEYFDINHTKRPYITKRSLYLANNKTEKKRRKECCRAKSYQNLPIQNKTNKKNKTYNNKTTRKIPKEENKSDTLNDVKMEDYHKIKYNKTKRFEHHLLKRIKDIENSKPKKKKDLYQLNVRQATAWNKEYINKIIPKRKCGFIIEGLL